MNFKDSVKYVETSTKKSRDKADLSIIKELLNRAGNPHHNFKSIHVAGTNGKGSVCAYIECALREQGYKTGLFASPVWKSPWTIGQPDAGSPLSAIRFLPSE